MARRFRVALATEADRRTIYGVRHEVYARELGQHLENAERSLHDALDDGNVYVVARLGVAVVGFVSLTPPGHGAYSLDKYLRRDEMPFPLDAGTWEIRILTVVPEHRGTVAAALLMYAAFRWVEAHGGSRVIALGRREVRGMYGEAGLTPCGRELRAGEVDYVPMTARPAEIRQRLARFDRLLRRLEGAADWRLVVPFLPPAPCFHGGAFFDAIGDGFDALHRRTSVINADVLDAWFPPSPRVMAALEEHLPWLLRTSPPTGCAGMVRAIARARGVPPSAVLPGAGSSSLIYLALPKWLRPSSRVVLPEPAYGEYAHVLDHVVRCHVERHVLARPGGYALDLPLLERALAGGPDLLVLVNPNSPTGRHEPRRELESFLRRVPAGTLVWVDETYVDYADPGASLERFAVGRPNVVVCKSMSKAYALSGLRCAYLCASPHLLEGLRGLTPPWAVGLPAQVAAVAALEDGGYYAERYRETAALRASLVAALAGLGIDVVPGTANFLLGHLPAAGPSAAELAARCRASGLFVRDAATMGASLGSHAVRVAVKDGATNQRMTGILAAALGRRGAVTAVEGAADPAALVAEARAEARR